MSNIKEIKLKDGSSVYVEMDEVNEVPTKSVLNHGDLPPGAEEVTAAEAIIDAMEALKNNLQSVFNAVHESVKNNTPDEWDVELNIGFKGKVYPIPVIVGGESNVAIKVKAKWKKTSN